MALSGDGAHVETVNGGNKAISQVTVTTTATQLLALNLNRKNALFVLASGSIYLGKDNTVTASGATGGAGPISTTFEDDKSTDAWWAITSTGSADVRIIEVS